MQLVWARTWPQSFWGWNWLQRYWESEGWPHSHLGMEGEWLLNYLGPKGVAPQALVSGLCHEIVLGSVGWDPTCWGCGEGRPHCCWGWETAPKVGAACVWQMGINALSPKTIIGHQETPGLGGCEDFVVLQHWWCHLPGPCSLLGLMWLRNR